LENTFGLSRGGEELYIVAHSQGCVVACLANLPRIKKIFFLAPPTNNDLIKSIENFKKRPGTVIDFSGDSILMRRDGSKTIVPASYWQDRESLNYLELYKKLSRKNNLIIILAGQDDVVSNESSEVLSRLGKLVVIDGNHNFDNTRNLLAKTIKENF
jgi:esterase/lipase